MRLFRKQGETSLPNGERGLDRRKLEGNVALLSKKFHSADSSMVRNLLVRKAIELYNSQSDHIRKHQQVSLEDMAMKEVASKLMELFAPAQEEAAALKPEAYAKRGEKSRNAVSRFFSRLLPPDADVQEA